jgi:hypothetical protein
LNPVQGKAIYSSLIEKGDMKSSDYVGINATGVVASATHAVNAESAVHATNADVALVATSANSVAWSDIDGAPSSFVA